MHFPRVSAVTMTAAVVVGDHLIFEEDFDETYTRSEQGTLAEIQKNINPPAAGEIYKQLLVTDVKSPS